MINFVGINEVEFRGCCSGDGESFCWEVDKETYLKIKGVSEVDPYDSIITGLDDELNPIAKSNRFRIYPDDIFGFSDSKKERKIYVRWE